MSLTHPRGGGGGGGWGKLHLRLELLGTRCAARAGRSALAATLPWPEVNTGLELDWCLARHQAAECSATRPKQGCSALKPRYSGEDGRARARGGVVGPETTKPVS